ncbi:hypothetical protein EYF80_024092 [Liparis tanakae]|uniref:Uncharacterized protein n=1 Tax=Liparis tanakae TaxID=230148 RepID=A0A4Z2HIQ0_9TELE|nr:hypothetical protein EYF80_024092 [Liparis tanakae]
MEHGEEEEEEEEGEVKENRYRLSTTVISVYMLMIGAQSPSSPPASEFPARPPAELPRSPLVTQTDSETLVGRSLRPGAAEWKHSTPGTASRPTLERQSPCPICHSTPITPCS